MTALILITIIIVYLGLDALHDNAVIGWAHSEGKLREKYSDQWHFYDSIIKGFIMAALFWFVFGNIYDLTRWLIFFAAMRYGPFSIALNLIRKLPWNHTGKNILDKIGGRFFIPQFIFLIAAIILLALGNWSDPVIGRLISLNGLIAAVLIIGAGWVAIKMYHQKLWR